MLEILSNVVDQSLLGDEYQWSAREHFGYWLWQEHLSPAIRELDTGPDQSGEMRSVDSSPAFLGGQEQLEGHRQAGLPRTSTLGLLRSCFNS